MENKTVPTLQNLKDAMSLVERFRNFCCDLDNEDFPVGPEGETLGEVDIFDWSEFEDLVDFSPEPCKKLLEKMHQSETRGDIPNVIDLS